MSALYLGDSAKSDRKWLGRFMWFLAGALFAAVCNQLLWQQKTQIIMQPAIQSATDRESEELDKMLDEMNNLRKDITRMKASRDLQKEKTVACESQLNECASTKKQAKV
jgi:hypothetical protein